MAQSDSRKGKFSTFTDEQRATLLKYFNDYGMTSTHRKNADVLARCAAEVGTTVPKVKNWIGSEVVKRKRKAGILPLPKFEFSSGSPELKPSITPPTKKIRRVNGYNLFFSEYVQNHSDLGPDFKERNAIVAQQWAELSDEERKTWAARAEVVCTASIQEFNQQQQITDESSLMSNSNDENIVEKTLLSIQEKFEILEQLGFEGYAILVNTNALQTHLLATNKGKSYHKQRQNIGKPLENPFIGYVFSDNAPPDLAAPSSAPAAATTQLGSSSNTSVLSSTNLPLNMFSPLKVAKNSTAPGGMNAGTPGMTPGTPPSGVNTAAAPGPAGSNTSLSVETMQRSVANAFALKYKVTMGRSEVPYDSLDSMNVVVYGMPNGIPFHSPFLYNQQQLQQILANLEKIVFLKLPLSSVAQEQEIPHVQLDSDSVTSLVGVHLPAGP